jgi:putative DNA primase/helicase
LKVLHHEFEVILPNLLGYIFDILVQVLSRIGEVRLKELPRMADFVEMGELIARCLGYKRGESTDAYNHNIGFTNQEAIDSSPVATAIIAMMDKQPSWIGRAERLRVELNKLVIDTEELKGLMYSKGWPRTPRSMRARLNEITPNLKEIGIVSNTTNIQRLTISLWSTIIIHLNQGPQS